MDAKLPFELWPIDKIVPYDRNPRINENAVHHVLESLRRHGQVRPLIVSAPGAPFEGPVLCCGHTSLKALKEFGAKEVMVQAHPFKDEAEFADYNVRDNKSASFAEWDQDILAALSVDFDIDLEAMGFDLTEKDFEPEGGKPERPVKTVKCPNCSKVFNPRG